MQSELFIKKTEIKKLTESTMVWKKFSLNRFFNSFAHAINGVIFLLKSEQNARVHATNAIIVAILAYIFEISATDMALLFIAVIMVFAIEIINTAIEKVFDVCHPDQHPVIRGAKDAMAGAVLIAAIISLAVEILIFAPFVKRLFF